MRSYFHWHGRYTGPLVLYYIYDTYHTPLSGTIKSLIIMFMMSFTDPFLCFGFFSVMRRPNFVRISNGNRIQLDDQKASHYSYQNGRMTVNFISKPQLFPFGLAFCIIWTAIYSIRRRKIISNWMILFSEFHYHFSQTPLDAFIC